MNASDNQLNQETHKRVFADKIIPDSRIDEISSQARPRAIILGGQPGAGKGGLARRAEIELHNDVVKIDPDALRDFHPNAERLQSVHPYTWSGDTHPDASQWADELREAAVDGRKNFIFDTTLSNGQWSSELIHDLQAKGYEVEVRVVAAHKLESEWGVDSRFTNQLDAKRYARYVPEAARDAIYDKVPASLDTIHAQIDVVFQNDVVPLNHSSKPESPTIPNKPPRTADMPELPPPPVPQRLCEMLKNYPEHIQELQRSLNIVINKPSHGVDPFERAIWHLEGALESFISEAREELQAAEASGDAEAIGRAKAKESLMFRARSSNGGMLNLSELRAYFDKYWGAFK